MMGMTVGQRGQHIATFRFVEVRLMEMLAAWVPSTPEMEAKLLFGPHIWDTAQAADALGRRTYELRLPLQHSVAPVQAYLGVLDTIAAAGSAAQRIAAFYDVLVPGMNARYRHYLEHTDSLMDAPSVRVVEGIVGARARMVREANELRRELPALQLNDPDWVAQLVALEASVDGIVVDTSAGHEQRQAA
jgi:hypothetical protein